MRNRLRGSWLRRSWLRRSCLRGRSWSIKPLRWRNVGLDLRWRILLLRLK